MAVLSGATASGRVMFAGALPATSTTLYTAPVQTSNVTGQSATAYIKEIQIGTPNGSAATVTLTINGVSLFGSLSVAANDCKVLSGLNTMIPASATIVAYANTGSGTIYISGVEIQ